MDIACDLAVGRLLNAHDAPFETFVEADDPDDPDSGTHYKEEYQKEYDTYYDKEYARVAKLMKFDYCQCLFGRSKERSAQRGGDGSGNELQ